MTNVATRPLSFLSLGWGIQSSALAAMMALDEIPRADYLIHADTTHEKAATYAFAALALSLTGVLLGCGLLDDEQASTKREAEPQVREMQGAAVAYDGATSLEERIFWSPVIARVRLSSVSSSVESGPTVRGTKYIPLLEFSFTVLEYLKGSGPSSIVAVWNAAS